MATTMPGQSSGVESERSLFGPVYPLPRFLDPASPPLSSQGGGGSGLMGLVEGWVAAVSSASSLSPDSRKESSSDDSSSSPPSPRAGKLAPDEDGPFADVAPFPSPPRRNVFIEPGSGMRGQPAFPFPSCNERTGTWGRIHMCRAKTPMFVYYLGGFLLLVRSEVLGSSLAFTFTGECLR